MRVLGRPRALVCDDEKSICFICERALAAAGYDVTTVLLGREAVEAVRATSFDVLLLDVRLPDLDGPSVLAELEQLDPDLPVVVISAYSSFEDAILCLRHGAVDFVRKPFDLEAVVRAADRALGSTHLKADAAVLAAAQTLFSSLDAEEVTRRVLRVLVAVLDASEGALAVPEREAAVAVRREGDGRQAVAEMPFAVGTWERVASLRDPVLLSRGVSVDADLIAGLAPAAGELILERLAVGGRTVGALWAARPVGARAFGDRDLRRARLLGGYIALALDNARLYSRAERQAKELEEALDRLVVSERTAVMGRLSACLGHEIGNPASAILANLEAAADALGPSGAPAPQQAIARARAGANAILDICERLRPLSGAASRGGAASVRRAAEGAAFLASYELRPRAQIVLDLPEHLPFVRCELPKLGQVFLNLFLNAGEAIEPGHPSENVIRVTARPDGAEVAIKVTDTGRGVPPELRAGIFEPRVSGRDDKAGHGMGLAICRWIVEDAGGSIRCLDVDRGAAFEVRLPARAALSDGR